MSLMLEERDDDDDDEEEEEREEDESATIVLDDGTGILAVEKIKINIQMKGGIKFKIKVGSYILIQGELETNSNGDPFLTSSATFLFSSESANMESLWVWEVLIHQSRATAA